VTPGARTALLRRLCGEQGIERVGVAAAGPTGEAARLEEWLGRGYHGGMAWMARWREKRTDPRELVPGARAVVSVALNYYRPAPREPGDGEGRVARYAWAEDYHRVLRDKLRAVLAGLRDAEPNLGGRAFVDSAPLQEKLWAERAGVGWRGKSTNLITKDLGSWIVLGELVLDRELVADAPHADHCGTCTRCLDACPTGAIVEPWVLDARRCLSYLTIEHRGELPGEFADDMREWVFGCDVCQEVCPWNVKHATPATEARLAPRLAQVALDLAEAAELDDAAFHARFADAAISRARPEGLRRNARAILEARTRAADGTPRDPRGEGRGAPAGVGAP
jgi:epoxyqueuosine reductase